LDDIEDYFIKGFKKRINQATFGFLLCQAMFLFITIVFLDEIIEFVEVSSSILIVHFLITV